MKIPKNLKVLGKRALKGIIRAQQRAIWAECRRCLGRKTLQGIKDCGGLHLEDGDCPLHPFSPWG